jgi:pyruvate formate lyase activating enzyme
MKCLYCHNPDTIPLDWWKEYDVEKLMETVYKSKWYFWTKGWVTISGGECLLQAKELIPLFKRLKEEWFHTCLDTNWYIWNKDVEKLLQYTDLVLLDIKHLHDPDHVEITWVSNKNTLNFANHLEENGIKFWIRHVLVPRFTDDKEHLEDMWMYFKNFIHLERFEILPYHTMWVHKWENMWWEYKLSGIKSPDKEQQLFAKGVLENYLPVVKIRG